MNKFTCNISYSIYIHILLLLYIYTYSYINMTEGPYEIIRCIVVDVQFRGISFSTVKCGFSIFNQAALN